MRQSAFLLPLILKQSVVFTASSSKPLMKRSCGFFLHGSCRKKIGSFGIFSASNKFLRCKMSSSSLFSPFITIKRVDPHFGVHSANSSPTPDMVDDDLSLAINNIHEQGLSN